MHGLAGCGLLILTLLSTATNVQAQVHARGEPATGTISGHVTLGGRPAPRIPVILQPYDQTTGTTRWPRATTDEEGNYRLTRVPEGRFMLSPVSSAFVIVDGPEQIGTGLFSGYTLTGVIVTITRGDVIERADFALAPGGVITGRVTDYEGRPLIAALVSCYGVNEQGSFDGSSSTSQSDDRGIYRIYGLSAGNYMVSVSGLPYGARPYRQTFYSDAVDHKRATPVHVAAGTESSGIDISLGRAARGYAIRGRVVDGETGQPVPGVPLAVRGYGRVIEDETGRPVFGVPLPISSSASTQRYSTTLSDGRFEIRDSPPGRYEVAVSTTGPPNQGYYSDPVTTEVGDADIDGLEIKAHRGASISGVVSVEGSNDPSTIVALSQSTLGLSIVPPANTAHDFDPSSSYVPAAIGSGGRFEFTGLRPGKMKLEPGSLPQGFVFLRAERDGVPIRDTFDLSPGERITGVRVVVAYGTGSIRGRVRVEGGVLPSKMGWIITVSRADGEEVSNQLIDVRGLFWVKGLVPGVYEVTAFADYNDVPGVTPTPHPPLVKQQGTVENGAESQVLLVLDLGGGGKKS